MGVVSLLFALTAAAIVAVWGWLGAKVEMPQALLARGEKMHCVSYAPFRGAQDPFGPDVPIDPGQIEADLAQLKLITDCIRTYSTDHGLDQIPEIAKRHGLKVMQGLWLSSRPDLTRKQIETGVALAKRYPDVIEAIVVGNEVLLRGEMGAPQLAETIREVKAQVSMPVTYADVWEFWLRNPEVAAAVDFITIHILPYWEDFPIPAKDAARHLDAIRQRIMAAFPGREIFVGEFGWPSAGRMREGALPSPANQARTIQEVLAQAKRNAYRANVIEAYDQPWKRQLEGTVGGHWGLYGAYRREPKFAWGAPVSNHPDWPWQAAGGVGFAAVIFAGAYLARRTEPSRTDWTLWLRIAAIAFAGGFTIGWTVANVPLESLTVGDWVRSLGWTAIALVTPVAVATMLARERTLPTLDQMLGRAARRPDDGLSLLLGALLVALVLLSIQAALGLVFDPRYRDFPFAPLTAAAIALLFAVPWEIRLRAERPAAESAIAITLILSAIYIACNESFANWQSLWFCAGLSIFALTLLQARAAPS